MIGGASTLLPSRSGVASSEAVRRVVRFLAVGVLNTAVGYGLYAIALWAGAAPRWALAIQFVLGVLWNFATHRTLVFGMGALNRLPRYALAYVVVFLVNLLLLEGVMSFGVGPYLAQAAVLPAVVALSYVLVARALGVGPASQPEKPR